MVAIVFASLAAHALYLAPVARMAAVSSATRQPTVGGQHAPMTAARYSPQGPRMMPNDDDIEWDGIDSWDDQIAEEAAWLAYQQMHNDGAMCLPMDARWMPEQQMAEGALWMAQPQMEGGPWMAEQQMGYAGGPWMAEQQMFSHSGAPQQAEAEQQMGYAGGPWMAEQQMFSHSGAPQQAEMMAPNGCYPDQCYSGYPDQCYP